MERMENLEQSNMVTQEKKIQLVQCPDRWSTHCLNKNCWAFKNVNGRYCCSSNRLTKI
jgi:hypothetical protein